VTFVPDIPALLGRKPKKPIARSAKPIRHASKKAAAKWAAVRKQALERDNGICQQCGKPGNDVHHLEKRSLSPAKRYDLANLVTLCRVCHGERHA